MAQVEYMAYMYFLADFLWWPVVVCILLNAVVLGGGSPGEYTCRAGPCAGGTCFGIAFTGCGLGVFLLPMQDAQLILLVLP